MKEIRLCFPISVLPDHWLGNVLVIVLLLLVTGCPEVVRAGVAVPPAYSEMQSHVDLLSARSASSTCDIPKPYTGNLVFDSKYKGSGSSRDKINKEAKERYHKQTKSFKDLQQLLTSRTDHIIRGEGDRGDTACIIASLLAWSRDSSLLTAAGNHTGQSMRKWTLAAISANLLKVGKVLSQYEKSRDVAEIYGWVGKLADVVVEDYSGWPIAKINNHNYWAAWAVMASAALLDRRDLYLWSRQMFSTAMRQLDGNGYLPNELKRKTRAAAYHNYALTPLVAIAMFLDANGDNPFEVENQALARLAAKVVASIDDPAIFREATGREQRDADLTVNGRLAWLAMYSVIADRGPLSLAEQCEPHIHSDAALKSSLLGGDVEFIFKVEEFSAQKKKRPKPGALHGQYPLEEQK